MHISLYGATGKSGSCILTELLSRSHHVRAVVRDTTRLAEEPNLEVVQGDVSTTEEIVRRIKGTDALVSAYAPPADDTDQLLAVTERFIAAVRQAGVGRFLLVGGAGSLEVAPGVTLIDSGHLPAPWLPIAKSHAKALEIMRNSEINWTNFSPAAYFAPGERTGKFRLGTDTLIADDKQQSRISMEDYAIAVADELENPRFERARFTIGY